MKNRTLTLFLLLLAIIVLATGNLFQYLNFRDTQNNKTEAMKNDSVIGALDIIHQRKSVRNFTGEQVDTALLTEIVKAGMAAPSARNLQPWAFIVVTDRILLDSLCAVLPYAKMLSTAGAAIVVCGDMNKAASNTKTDYWVQDCSAATENILLATEALGLGGVWTAAFPYDERINPVRSVLNLPENLMPLNVIPIGHPTGEDKPKDKWKPENVHWNSF
ncbi:MAG TPA: nitroreductase family protein [Bacteroidales bacterium]|nr:nitroreductase family protein [Bacteroidales bacterium]